MRIEIGVKYSEYLDALNEFMKKRAIVSEKVALFSAAFYFSQQTIHK
jgi:hypothetical protein